MDSAVLISMICSFVIAVLTLIGLIYHQSNHMVNIVSKKLFIYLFTSLVIFGGLGALATKFGSLTQSFWLLEIIVFGLGVAFYLTINKMFAWRDKNKFLPTFLLALVIVALGATAFIGSYSFFAKKSSAFVPEMLAGLLTFLLPYLFFKT